MIVKDAALFSTEIIIVTCTLLIWHWICISKLMKNQECKGSCVVEMQWAGERELWMLVSAYLGPCLHSEVGIYQKDLRRRLNYEKVGDLESLCACTWWCKLQIQQSGSRSRMLQIWDHSELHRLTVSPWYLARQDVDIALATGTDLYVGMDICLVLGHPVTWALVAVGFTHILT